MSDLYWLSDTQMAKLEPFFPKSHGKPRVDDRRVMSGIIFVNRNGLRWRDAPADYGPHKTLYSRWKRWSEKGIFARMLLELADPCAPFPRLSKRPRWRWVRRLYKPYFTMFCRWPNDKWHLDEVVITIRGKKHWLWRAIGADGDVLDILVQTRRSAKAAKRFFGRLIAQFGEPRVVITDKLRSYIKPVSALASQADHRAHKGLNNAIEVSHRPTRKREKIFGRFKSHWQAQRFLSAHDQINLIFRPRRYQLTATSYRHAHKDAFSLWTDYTAEMVA